ncbi:beta-lactamase family protein [Aquimarina sp. TRL1]|uniref:serine hydrolase domain-containing protein n=1 Tax=Aquimarina sp. (strain TRL1) TaxID=2736252 RepID=UPI001588355D|nr:serine hydrolase domain-containing protein [Aquimarina sp. TRL1]QKX06801.1 beta-lactamase family protein [Aquimarina sp. TRL1]
MKNYLHSFFVFIFLVLLTACQQERNTKNQVKKNIDQGIKNWLAKTGIPSVSFVVFKEGHIICSQAYGYTNLKSKTPATTATIYNTGSNFKSVTATAIMQLHEKGLLNIDTPINEYLQEPIAIIDQENPITPRQLMAHQSGIPSTVDMYKIWGRNPGRSLRTIAAAVKPIEKPNTKHIYSNDGYALLGILIEDVTGMSYEAYVWEHILKPLGIKTYGFVQPTPEMVEDLALPYHMRYNKAFPTHQLHIEQYPAGDIFLKPEDMATFLMMHLNYGRHADKQLLSKENIQKMHRPNLEVVENFYYGLGFGIDKIKGKEYSYHQGSLPGYLSVFQMDFETVSGVYIATNVNAAPMQEKQLNLLLKYLYAQLITKDTSVSLEIPSEGITATAIPKEISLQNYIGNYKIKGTSVSLTIDTIGNQLFLLNPSKERFRIDYLKSNYFFITTENEEIEFGGADGSIDWLKLYSGGNEITAIRE